jgi:hypothetical protein
MLLLFWLMLVVLVAKHQEQHMEVRNLLMRV